jgi:hypothetical protein
VAYIFVDTFDAYSLDFLSSVYDTVSNINGNTIAMSSAYTRFPAIGSFPNQGIHLWYGSLIRKNINPAYRAGDLALILIPFFTFGGQIPSSGYSPLITFWMDGTIVNSLVLTAGGALSFYAGSSPVTGGSTPNGLIRSTSAPTYGIELSIQLGPGIVTLWVSGVEVLTFTNPYIGNSVDQVSLGGSQGWGAGGSGDMYCDYFRLWDASGSYQNAAVGYDCRKLTKLPSGAGSFTQWTPNGASSNWQCVDDLDPDGDSTYVSTAATNYDSYSMGSAGLAGIPSMVVARSIARKNDALTRKLQNGVLSGSSKGLGTAATLSTVYSIYDTCISVDPATGAPPLAAAADAFQHLKYEAS